MVSMVLRKGVFFTYCHLASLTDDSGCRKLKSTGISNLSRLAAWTLNQASPDGMTSVRYSTMTCPLSKMVVVNFLPASKFPMVASEGSRVRLKAPVKAGKG